MAYTKTAWLEDGSTPINATRLNNLETQYDEAVAQAAVVRADNTKELRAEVVATLTGETAEAGRLVLNSNNGFFYGGDGSAFNLIGGGINIKSRQLLNVEWSGNTNTAELKADRIVALSTPVTDYTKCIVIMHGYAPFLTSGTYAYAYTDQVVRARFYGKLTANNSLTVTINYPDIIGATGWSAASQSLIDNWRGCFLKAEIIELEGAKSITLVEKSFTNQLLQAWSEALPAGLEPSKCLIIPQGGFLQAISSNTYFRFLEMLEMVGYVTGTDAVINYAHAPYVDVGGGYSTASVYQTIKMAYYILETF